jgi:hypothetical protein
MSKMYGFVLSASHDIVQIDKSVAASQGHAALQSLWAWVGMVSAVVCVCVCVCVCIAGRQHCDERLLSTARPHVCLFTFTFLLYR